MRPLSMPRRAARLTPLLGLLLLGCPSEEECVPQAEPGPTPTQRPAGRNRAWQVWIGGAPGEAIGPGTRHPRLTLQLEAPEPLALVHEAPGACPSIGCSAALRRDLETLPVGENAAEGVTLIGRSTGGAAYFDLTHSPPGRLVLIRLGDLDPAATLTTLAWAQTTQCGGRPTVGFEPINAGRGVCGDGLQDGTETCDDGNEVAGDGCSKGALAPQPSADTCQVEAPRCDGERAGGWRAWTCRGEPSLCEAHACRGDDGLAMGTPCTLPASMVTPTHTLLPVALGRRPADAAASGDPVWADTGAERIPCALAPGHLTDSPACEITGWCPQLSDGPQTLWQGCEGAAGRCTLPDPTTARWVVAARPVGPQTLTPVAPVADPLSATGQTTHATRVAAAFGHTLAMNRSGRLTMRRADGLEWQAAVSPTVEWIAPRPDGGAWVAARLRQRFADGTGAFIQPVAEGDGLVVQPLDPVGRYGRPQAFGVEGALHFASLHLAALPDDDGVPQVLLGLSEGATGEARLMGVRGDGRPGVDRGLGPRTHLSGLVAVADGAVAAVQAWGPVAGAAEGEPGATLLGLDPWGELRWATPVPGDPMRAGMLVAGSRRLAWLGPAAPGAAWVEVDPSTGAAGAVTPVDLPACTPLLGAAPTVDGGLVALRGHCHTADVYAVTRWDADGAVRWTERLAGLRGETRPVGLTVQDDAPLLWGRFADDTSVADRALLAP